MLDRDPPSAPVLVTGATGNVGRPVVSGLRAAGLPVRATARSMAEFGPDPDGVETVAFDFTDSATWGAAFDSVTTMFLVRPPQLGKPKSQIVPALEAARAAGVEHIVLLSLQGAEKLRVVPHAALEAWLRESGLGWTFVRPSFFMQNLTTTHLTDIRDRDELVVPAGRGSTAFVDTADVAAVVVAALRDPAGHTGRAWTPTGPEALRYDEVAAILTEVLERPIRYDAPGLLRYLRHARRELAMPWGMAVVTSAIYTTARTGNAAALTDDVREVTGREPTSFADFVRRERATWS